MALQQLIQAAFENGVEVRGGLEVRSEDDDAPDWDVLITEIRRLQDDD